MGQPAHLAPVGSGRRVFSLKQIARKHVAGAVRRVRTPGTFSVDNRHDRSLVRLIYADQAFARQPLARETTQDSHLNPLDPVSARNV